MERKEALEVMVNSTESKLERICKEIMRLRDKLWSRERDIEFEKQLWKMKSRLKDAADIGRTMILECEAGKNVADSKPPPSEGMSPRDSK